MSGEKIEGLLIKGFNGFYYVESDDIIWECSLRGKFKIKKQSFLPGDMVILTALSKNKGVIEEVLPRHNQLQRPPLANISRVIVTFAAINPEPDLLLLDRILLQVSMAGITPIICFNKADLLSDEELEKLTRAYKDAGYTVVATSAYSNTGVDELIDVIKGNIIVFAGPSGVGKSSLINSIAPNLDLTIGELSKKVMRGKHTTRRVELLKLYEDTYVADTPGFSNLYLPDEMQSIDLMRYYPDLEKHSHKCQFNSCKHISEPVCSVKDALKSGDLDQGRYERYLFLFNELKEREGKY